MNEYVSNCRKTKMDRFDYMDTSNKITCLIEIALKGEISSLNLDLLINGLTPTIEASRQIIRILLKEFERHQSISKVKKADGELDFKDKLSLGVSTYQQKDAKMS